MVVLATTGKKQIMKVMATIAGRPWPSQRTKMGARMMTGVICRIRM
jgi:hypothetical protein